ncbi:uncharacterized protein V6R79_023832 [Siganus canaliculatus]
MATVEMRRSGGSAKTSKKGGKRVKALTAEEDARRREVLKEKLREKLELEKRALKVVERLLEDCVTEDFLSDCAKFITPANYKDTVEERSIAKLCGYPVCPNKLGKVPTQQYKISTKTNKVYDITERKCFCSNFCYKASKEFELQISNTPLWLRLHESPPVIKLMKKGEGGSSGEEIILSERRLREKDIEDPQPEDPPGSQQRPASADHSNSESSDNEQEQDFVSSVVSQRQGPRVHWGHLPKRTDEDDEDKPRKTEKPKTQRRDKDGGRVEVQQRLDAEMEGKLRIDEKKLDGANMVDEKMNQPRSLITDKPGKKQLSERSFSEEPSVEEASSKLRLCTLSETVPHSAAPPDDQTTSPGTAPTGLDIAQVGMSKRGAAGLRDLLKNHTATAEPSSVRQSLLQCLKNTLKEWTTDSTLTFLYGDGHSLVAPFTDVPEEKEEEELDEDDLEEEDVENSTEELLKTAPATAPDYETLRKETQQLDLRVREFYKGTWIMPEKVEGAPGDRETVQDQRQKEPVLPLVDSHAQHVIQKRITVEKLTSCLRNIVGPLHLTMSDISTDLNNLVRTFSFTNKNIIHKTPEWTLIAVVLLHLLSRVSPLVRGALEKPASVQYLSTLMEELGLQEQDLVSLVQMFGTPAQ